MPFVENDRWKWLYGTVNCVHKLSFDHTLCASVSVVINRTRDKVTLRYVFVARTFNPIKFERHKFHIYMCVYIKMDRQKRRRWKTKFLCVYIKLGEKWHSFIFVSLEMRCVRACARLDHCTLVERKSQKRPPKNWIKYPIHAHTEVFVSLSLSVSRSVCLYSFVCTCECLHNEQRHTFQI